MYFPYFRGKQFELISIRENAELLSEIRFVPIIEPVKESLNGLKRALDAINDAGGRGVLIVNPVHGDFADDNSPLIEFTTQFADKRQLSLGIILTEVMSVSDVTALCDQHAAQKISLIHAGFTRASDLENELGDKTNDYTHIFLEDHCRRGYRKHFQSTERVLISDGFRKQPNSKYPSIENFSDLHATFEEDKVDAFGDFLIVGSDYQEGGGPAYTVAIHLTFIDPDRDNEMFIHHFKSNPSSSPKDPAGKFAEALERLVEEVDKSDSHIFQSTAVEEFFELHRRGHFPGLGSVKKLSMNHHIETLANYFSVESPTRP